MSLNFITNLPSFITRPCALSNVTLSHVRIPKYSLHPLVSKSNSLRQLHQYSGLIHKKIRNRTPLNQHFYVPNRYSIVTIDFPKHFNQTGKSFPPKNFGLFGNPEFHSPEAICAFGKHSAQIALDLIHQILNKDQMIKRTSQQWQLSDTTELIGLFDNLSNTICMCTDASEVIRNLHPDPSYVRAAESVYTTLSSMVHTLNTHTELYHILAQAVKPHINYLTPMQLRNAEVFLRDFELAGIHLSDQHHQQYATLSNEINTHVREFLTFPFPPLQISLTEPEFSNLCTKKHSIELFSPSFSKVKQNSSTNSTLHSNDDHLKMLTMTYQQAQQLLCVSELPSVRRKLFFLMHDPHPKQEVNLMKMLTKRHQLANLLGYPSFSDWYLQDKMLNTPEKVSIFLNSEAKRLLPTLKSTLQSMRNQKTIAETTSLDPNASLQAWDTSYYLSKLTSLDTSSHWTTTFNEALCVFQKFIKKLYNVDFKCVSCTSSEVWDPSVTKWRLSHPQEGVLGSIYFDVREQHSSSLNQAAHFTVQCKSIFTDQTGIVVIRLPFRPSLGQWRWYHVETLFHELGHAMHALLSLTPYQNTSGTRCAFDLGEVPSILMELLLGATWTRDQFRHPAPVPSTSSTWDSAQQLLSSIYDLSLHSAGRTTMPITEWFHKLHTSPSSIFSSMKYPSLNEFLECMPWTQGMHPHLRFQHLATYASGYYSYLWCRQLAQCIYQKLFFNQDHDWSQQGNLVWKEFLGWGGGRDPWECMGAILNEKNRDTLFHDICDR
ncbi:Mitochondrial intermediate peptidase [Coelomomyces lativittatus]|nr:Mitochondrial intermediate peptidase [Coelomomyces lativittatus]KAJ1508902.1 Mitochondrial intermediate peptidase [Coelomomyces lativittatus]KAJ1512335.1 Mitochondrial intermediate peptidase [Coelomomyces lativittatus]